jgi:hypothetical protein
MKKLLLLLVVVILIVACYLGWKSDWKFDMMKEISVENMNSGAVIT